jgi:hypothetical protein
MKKLWQSGQVEWWPGNRALAAYLAMGTFQNDMLPTLSEVVSNVLGCNISFSLLIGAVNKHPPGQRSNPQFYNQDTVVEFHMLLHDHIHSR